MHAFAGSSVCRQGQRFGALGDYVPAFRSVVTWGESRPAVCCQKRMDLLRQRLGVCVVLYATVCHRGQLVTACASGGVAVTCSGRHSPSRTRQGTASVRVVSRRGAVPYLCPASWTHHRDTVSVCVGNAGNRPRYERHADRHRPLISHTST